MLSKWAKAFFSTLAQKKHNRVSPIYNLLPDMLSHLTREMEAGKLQEEDMTEIMGVRRRQDCRAHALATDRSSVWCTMTL